MKRLIIILGLSGFYTIVNAQVKDIQLWTGPTVKYNISKKIRLDFEQQFRFKENISTYNYTLSEFGLKYKLFEYLDLKATFRQSFLPSRNTGTEISDNNKSRVYLDASTGIKIFNTGIKAGYRFRYEHSWENITLVPSDYLRNRFELDYNLSKLVDPYADWESFFRLNRKNEFRQNRCRIGLNWNISKKLNIDSYYLYMKDINVKNPETNFIIGLQVEYSIN